MILYTQAQLQQINISLKAKAGIQYVVETGPNKGSLYEGQRDGTLKFITNNFDFLAQNAVGSIVTNTETSNTTYTPVSMNDPGKIDTTVNQMNLGDVLAFAAAHG